MSHVALYCRESRDKLGRAENVADQEHWGRDYAAVAWPGVPVVVYVDNDISAASGDHRPGYEALREAIERGEVAHLWVAEQSRLERTETGWFRLAAELTAAGIPELHSRREGMIRPGDVVSGVMAVLNAHEVRRLKERLMDRLGEIASQGRPPGSKPFGYEHAVNEAGEKTYNLVPGQAAAIRFAADKILSGWSLSSVAAALREQGLTGAHGGRITAGAVRSMVTSPTIAGHRIHHGADVGKGNWVPILDEASWQACRAKLAAPRVVDRTDGGTYQVGPAHTGYTGRKYVLTGGLARCGVCGDRLGGQRLQAAKGKPYLICLRRRSADRRGSCVGIMAEATEQYVVDELFAELDKPGFLTAIVEDTHAGRREEIVNALSAVEAQRGELAKMWGTPGELTTEEWQAARQALATTERELRTELAAKPAPPARVNIEEARSSWPFMDLGEQREFLRLFIDRVTINRAVPGRKGFDSNRVEITWRGASHN